MYAEENNTPDNLLAGLLRRNIVFERLRLWHVYSSQRFDLVLKHWSRKCVNYYY